MDCFAKIVNDFYTLTVFTKRSILDIWQVSEYASDCLQILEQQEFRSLSP